MLNFERIQTDLTGNGNHEIYRTKVPKGWLVATDADLSKNSLTFVPDPNHSWRFNNDNY